MIFTLEKRLNMSRAVRNIYDKFIWSASADHIKTASDDGIILASGKKKEKKMTIIAKLRRLCSFVS